MSEQPTARPAPLRVPVIDVATRSSLVSPTPKPEAAQPAVVIHRAVRVVSDSPAIAPNGESAHVPSDLEPTAVVPRPLEAELVAATRSAEAPGPAALPPPSVKLPTGRIPLEAVPRPPEVVARAESSELSGASVQVATSLAESFVPVESEGLEAVELPEGIGDDDVTIDRSIEEVERSIQALEHKSDDVENERDFQTDEGNLEEEALNDEDLSEEDVGEEEVDGEEIDEEEHVLDVSLPPPAPPEALRAKAPAQSDDDQGEVEITVSEVEGLEEEVEPDDDTGRPSGEFEELDLDAEAAREAEESVELQRSLPPPPPPPRLHIPEPPDLSTLTRTARVQELRPSKPRNHPWWEVFFDDDYLRTVRPPTAEQIARQCDFLERRMRLKPGATLLDVGCGLGLTVVELCTRGYLGVGLDLSLAMLSRASEEAQSRGMRINFLHSDMRDMNFEGTFDALMCLGTTFGYFDDETNRKVLERFLRALKPGGVLVLDVVNRDHVIRAQPNLVWFEGDGCVCMEESEFNFFTSRLHIKRTVILDGGKQAETEYALRLYSLHELGQLLHSAGFRVTEVSGREALPGVFFGQESPQMIIVAERRLPNEGGANTTAKINLHE